MCPNAADDSFTFAPGELQDLYVTVNDSVQSGAALDIATLEVVLPPEHDVDGDFLVYEDRITYRAETGYEGPDSLTYRICNVDALCDTATVAITIDSSTPAPDVCNGFTDSQVRVSFHQERRNSYRLHGLPFVGARQLYIFAVVPDTTESVSFYVDDRKQLGLPWNVESTCPYDLRGPGDTDSPYTGFSLHEFGTGFHSVSILITDQDGSTDTRTAIFSVLTLGSGEPTVVHPPIGVDCEAAVNGETDLQGADLRNCDLRGLDLSSLDLDNADLRGSNLDGVDLSQTQLQGANLSGASAVGADLMGAKLDDVVMVGTDLTGAVIKGTDMDKADLSAAVLVGADLSGSIGAEVILTDADLTGANLQSADFKSVDLTQAVLSNAVLFDTRLDDGDLTDAVLTNAALEGAHLHRVDMTGADFTGATGTPHPNHDGTFSDTVCPAGHVSNTSCW